MFDLPGDADIAAIATQVYEKGGILSAVCHGTVGASRSVGVSVCLPWHCWCVTLCQCVCLSAMALLVRHALSVFVCLSAVALLVRHALSVCLSVMALLVRHALSICLSALALLVRHALSMFAMALLVRHALSVCLSVCQAL